MTSTATASGNSKGRNLPTIIQTLTQYYMQCSAHYQQQPQHQHAQHSFMHQQTRPYNQSPQMNFSNSASAAQIKTSNHQAPPFMQQYPSAGVGLGLPGMGPGGAYPHQNAGGMQQQAVHGHQMGTTPSNPNVDHRGVLSVMPDQQNSAAHSFSALPAKQVSKLKIRLMKEPLVFFSISPPYYSQFQCRCWKILQARLWSFFLDRR